MARKKNHARKHVYTAPTGQPDAANSPRAARMPAFKRPAGGTSGKKAVTRGGGGGGLIGPRPNRNMQRALRAHRRRPGVLALQ